VKNTRLQEALGGTNSSQGTRHLAHTQVQQLVSYGLFLSDLNPLSSDLNRTLQPSVLPP